MRKDRGQRNHDTLSSVSRNKGHHGFFYLSIARFDCVNQSCMPYRTYLSCPAQHPLSHRLCEMTVTAVSCVSSLAWDHLKSSMFTRLP